MNNTNMNKSLSTDKLFNHKGELIGIRILLENGELVEHGRCYSRCLVKGCQNTPSQGKFVGDLCKPCHDYLVSGKIGPTSSFLGDLKQVSPAPAPPPTLLPARRVVMKPSAIGFSFTLSLTTTI